MFAKIFNQIYDSSIVENPETRFTFMDFLILADPNGVVDMTQESIARRTNRPLELIRKTIAELEGPDPKSRTPDEAGARIYRLDEHRDWGWGIVNYDYFRKLASQEQRREKTRLRTRKWRKSRESSSVTPGDAPKRSGDDSPSSSSYSSVLQEGVRGRFADWVKVRKAMGKKPKDWDTMFSEQASWLAQFTEADQLEILSASIRNNWQGLFEPKKQAATGAGTTPKAPSVYEIKSRIEAIDEELGKTQWHKDQPAIAGRRKVLFARKKELKAQLIGDRPTTKYGCPLPRGCSIRKDGEVLDYIGRIMDVNQVKAAARVEKALQSAI